MTEPPADPSTESTAPPPPPRKSLIRRIACWGFTAVIVVLLLGLIGWSSLAILYGDISIKPPRTGRAVLFAIVAIASLLFIKPRKWGIAVVLVLFAGALFWFLSLKPSDNRDWAPEYTRLVTCKLDGNLLTVHNIRNFDYRSETDYTPRWYDHTYDLSKLKSVDYILSYWGPTAIAHGMVSFEFTDDHPLTISVETRREKHETYSAVQGFFRQYEIIYIFADERDLLRLRTNYRGEDVYVYRTRIQPPLAREFLLDYVNTANQLAQSPDWYNAGVSNCSTNILGHLSPHDSRVKFSIYILLNGYSAQHSHEKGGLDQGRSFEELKRLSHINAAAQAADQDPEFSARIRAAIPEATGPAR